MTGGEVKKSIVIRLLHIATSHTAIPGNSAVVILKIEPPDSALPPELRETFTEIKE